MSIQMSRRSAVALGLGLLASAPAAAIAQTITKTGTSEAGEALEGLVTVHGRSYLYVGGELYKGGRREYRGKERYFHPEDGHMAVDETVRLEDGCLAKYGEDGSRCSGWVKDEDRWAWVTEDGSVKSGWLEDKGRWYLLDAQGHALTGWQLVDGEWYFLDTDSCAMVTGVRDGYYLSESGAWRAKDEGGWDFTDWGFVEEARCAAEADSSDTDYYVYVSWMEPCREVVFRWDHDSRKWIAVAGWYVGVGRRRVSDDVPRGCAGTFTITQRWAESDTGPGYCMDYIESYKGGAPSAWGNDSASFHAGMSRGTWGYTTHSCISNTDSRAKWMYDNVPLGTRMRNVGPMYGYGNGDDSNLRGAEVFDVEVQDPFA